MNSEDLVTKLKGFLSENTKIALKVDVEGFEEQVLRQLNNPKLSDNIEWLIVELDNNRQDFGAIKSLIESWGLHYKATNSQVFGSHGDYLFTR